MSRPTALVTGASRGIGAAVARELARGGANVVLAARGLDACRALAAELASEGAVARAVALDVTDAESIAAAKAEIEAWEGELGPLTWLVNNAGIATSQPLLAGPGEADALTERLMAVNFHGARHVAEAFLPGMKARGAGCVVNVASSAGLRGYAYVSAYCATKFALVGWTLAAAEELARAGVRANAVCPHYVDTPMLEASVTNLVEKTGMGAEEARAFFAKENPGGHLVDPADVARAVRALCEGDDSGLLVELDGGPAPLHHRPNQRQTAWTS